CSAFGGLVEGHAAAVGFHDGFHHAQAEAEATLGPAGVAAIKASENCLAFCCGDTGSVVGYSDDCIRPVATSGEGHGSACGSIFERVIEEVVYCLTEADGVDREL